MLYLAIPLYPQKESAYYQVLTSFQNHLVAPETGGEGVVLEGPGQVEGPVVMGPLTQPRSTVGSSHVVHIKLMQTV